MEIKLTETAAKELKRVAEEQKLENPHVRVGVSGGGCSGWQYDLKFEDPDKVDPKLDDVSEQFGLNVVVDRKAMLYLDGTKLDFYEDLNKRGFTFDNPLATKGCGCGKSFSTE